MNEPRVDVSDEAALPGQETDTLLEPHEDETDNDSHERRSQLLKILPALLLCNLVVTFDASNIIANYARRIASSLGDFKSASWIILGYIVSESAFLAMFGHAAQVYGHRNAMLFAVAAMCIGLLPSSVSQHIWDLAISRTVVGIGTAGVELLIIVIINDFVPLHELPLWTSAATLAGTIGLMFGGPVGATLMDDIGFRATFAIEFFAMSIASLGLYFTLRLPIAKSSGGHDATAKIEYPSAILLLLTVATPLVGINLGSEIFPLTFANSASLFSLTLALFVCLCNVESHANTPIVPGRFVKNKDIAIALACTLPMKFAFDQLRYSLGTYLEARSFQSDSTFSDWAQTCIYLGRAVGSIVCGLLVKRWRKFKVMLQIDIVVELILYVCLFAGWMHLERPQFAPLLLFMGAVEGFAEGLWLVAILSLVDVEDQALLYSFFILLQALSGDVGIAVSLAAEGSLVRSRLEESLRDIPNAAHIISKSLEDLNYIRTLSSSVQRLILDALISSIETAFGISCAVLLISLVSMWFVRDISRTSPGLSFAA